MKNLTIQLVAKTLVLVFCFCDSFAHHTKLSMQKALDTKQVTAKALCKGGLELGYTIINALKDSMVIVLPAGWRFNSNAVKNDYQDVLVTEEQIFALKANETKTFLVKGYCCELTKSGPVKDVPYTVGKLADSNLVSLARYLNVNAFDQNTKQQSVWAISNNQPTANITHQNDSLAVMLRSFVATLKGEPLPWFTLLKQAYISPSGAVFNSAIRFKAQVNYAIANTMYSYCYIIDGAGNKVSQISGKWLNPSETNYLANFDVKGLKKGNYKLVLASLNETLFERAFEI